MFTVLVSVSGWGFVFLLESLVSAPLVEYDVNWTQKSSEKTVVVKIENLSRNNRIKGILVGFASRAKEPGTFSNPRLQAIAPAAEGTDSLARIVDGGYEVQFFIMDLQPRRRFELHAVYTGLDFPELRLLHSDGPLYLQKSGVLTKLAKFSTEIVGTIVLVFLFLLTISLFLSEKDN